MNEEIDWYAIKIIYFFGSKNEMVVWQGISIPWQAFIHCKVENHNVRKS